MYRWSGQYQDEGVHTTSISGLMPDVENDEQIEFADKQSLPVDRIVYQKVCLKLLWELFDGLSDKDKSILGHSFAVYGYEKYALDQLGLKEMLTTDGVIKARALALRRLQELYKESRSQLRRSVHRILSDID